MWLPSLCLTDCPQQTVTTERPLGWSFYSLFQAILFEASRYTLIEVFLQVSLRSISGLSHWTVPHWDFLLTTASSASQFAADQVFRTASRFRSPYRPPLPPCLLLKFEKLKEKKLLNKRDCGCWINNKKSVLSLAIGCNRLMSHCSFRLNPDAADSELDPHSPERPKRAQRTIKLLGLCRRCQFQKITEAILKEQMWGELIWSEQIWKKQILLAKQLHLALFRPESEMECCR